MNAPDTHNPTPKRRRAAAIGVGICLTLVALVSLVAGGVLVGTHVTQRDANGFYATGAHTLTTPTYALVSEGLDVGADGPDWLFRKGRLGAIRVTATGTNTNPIFIGIARASEVDAYLRDVAKDEINDFEVDPFSVSTVRHPGTTNPTPPVSRGLWAASSTGSGKQALVWSVDKGNWDVVVMNADGARGVRTVVSVGAKVPGVLWIGSGLLALGALLAAAAAAAVYLSSRRRQRRPIVTPTRAPTAPVASGQ